MLKGRWDSNPHFHSVTLYGVENRPDTSLFSFSKRIRTLIHRLGSGHVNPLHHGKVAIHRIELCSQGYEPSVITIIRYRNIKIKVRGHHLKWISKIALTHLGPIDLNFALAVGFEPTMGLSPRLVNSQVLSASERHQNFCSLGGIRTPNPSVNNRTL